MTDANFSWSFSRQLLCLYVHISECIIAITLIWVSLERPFSPEDLESMQCLYWLRVMTSKVKQRLTLITGSYGQHRCQWVKVPVHFFISLILLR